MQEVNSLRTDSRELRAEYCIVGIPHNTAMRFILTLYARTRYVQHRVFRLWLNFKKILIPAPHFQSTRLVILIQIIRDLCDLWWLMTRKLYLSITPVATEKKQYVCYSGWWKYVIYFHCTTDFCLGVSNSECVAQTSPGWSTCSLRCWVP